MTDTSRPIRAGKAFVEANKDNPELVSKLEDLSHRLKAFYAGVSARLRKMGIDPTAGFHIESNEEFEEFVKKLNEEWMNKYGEPYPHGDLEKWEELASASGISRDEMNNIKCLDQIEPWIRGYLRREASGKEDYKKTDGASGLTCNDRMLAVFTRDKRCIGWSAEVWRKNLDEKSRSTITSTRTWKVIQAERERLRRDKEDAT